MNKKKYIFICVTYFVFTSSLINAGIHNYVASGVMTAKDSGKQYNVTGNVVFDTQLKRNVVDGPVDFYPLEYLETIEDITYVECFYLIQNFSFKVTKLSSPNEIRYFHGTGGYFFLILMFDPESNYIHVLGTEDFSFSGSGFWSEWYARGGIFYKYDMTEYEAVNIGELAPLVKIHGLIDASLGEGAVEWFDPTSIVLLRSANSNVDFDLDGDVDGQDLSIFAVKYGTITTSNNLSPPSLIYPLTAHGATLDNGCDDNSNPIEWNFYWFQSPDASHYHILARNNEIPIFSQIVDSTTYHFFDYSYIADENRLNWRWNVRSGNDLGQWSEWSETNYFNVEPVNTDCP